MQFQFILFAFRLDCWKTCRKQNGEKFFLIVKKCFSFSISIVSTLSCVDGACLRVTSEVSLSLSWGCNEEKFDANWINSIGTNKLHYCLLNISLHTWRPSTENFSVKSRFGNCFKISISGHHCWTRRLPSIHPHLETFLVHSLVNLASDIVLNWKMFNFPSFYFIFHIKFILKLFSFLSIHFFLFRFVWIAENYFMNKIKLLHWV